MPFAICKVPAAPIRTIPAHESVLVNQLRWGEAIEILDIPTPHWCQIKTISDGYTGWIDILEAEIADESEVLQNKHWVVQHPSPAIEVFVGGNSCIFLSVPRFPHLIQAAVCLVISILNVIKTMRYTQMRLSSIHHCSSK